MSISMSIPIYWISYKDEGDSSRIPRLVKKVSRMEKAIPNKQYIIKVPNLNQKEGHVKAILEAIKNHEKQIIIIEDKTTIVDINIFKNKIQSQWGYNVPLLHLGGYMEEKINNTEITEMMSCFKGNSWVLGKSRSCFAYWINLEGFKGLVSSWLDDSNDVQNKWENIIYNSSTAICSPMLIIPYGYDLEKGAMKNTLKGMSMIQFNESETDLSLKFDHIDDNKLPRITLLTIVTDQRLWWPLIRLNIDNINYPSKKMKWIIVDVLHKNYDTIEDLLPRRRGNPGGWELEYLQRDWNVESDVNVNGGGIDFFQVVKNLENENKLVGDFVVELDPQSYYPAFSVLSRVKTLLKYKYKGFAGSTQVQLYDIPNDQSLLIGDRDSDRDSDRESDSKSNIPKFIIGTNIVKKGYYNIEKTFDNSIKIPSQFVSYLINLPIGYSNRYTYTDADTNTNTDNEKGKLIPVYNGLDKFPDFLETEDFFADLVMIIDNMKQKYKRT